ncbi:MAG: hypothetical protein RMM06_01235 [Armatimonadota bacterium]|nr:hypothetical protein [Armatimonadota bacterium]MDW8289319.1 hypothetical protein [Armatimonadota bacterium]
MRLGKKLAIRDDDVCALTRWEEVDAVYERLWGKVCVSFSVIPFVGAPLPFRAREPLPAPLPLDSNWELVENLRILLAKRWASVSLHGYDHLYRKEGGADLPEYRWKPRELLVSQTVEGKSYLQRIFGQNVHVFVPPSNAIGRGGIAAIEEAGLHLSGVMGRWGDRPPSLSYFRAYVLRWGYRLFTGFPYPYPLRVGRHLELAYYSLTSSSSYERVRRALAFCHRRAAPFVLAVHYWELFGNDTLRHMVYEVVAEALKLGFEPSPLAECLQ